MSIVKGDQVKIKGADLIGHVTWKAPSADRVEVTVDDRWYVLPEAALEALPKPLKAGDYVSGERAYANLPVGTLIEAVDTWETGNLVRVNGGFIRVNNPAKVYREHDFSDRRKLLYVPES